MSSTLLTRRRIFTGTGIALAAALFFAVNILGNATLDSARLDLTENDLYTLTEGTRNILASLEEPVTLRLYVSKKLATTLPGINSYVNRVSELLQEYSRIAGDKIRLVTIDPEPFSEEEDRAVGYGLQGVPLDDGANTFYFGLVGTGSTDEEEVIPFFQPERESFLEYDITKLIHQLSRPKQQVVGLLSTLPLANEPMPGMFGGGSGEPWIVVEQMRQMFDVRDLETDMERIPEDVDVLMLVHPKELPPQTLYAIDQFIVGGGRALIFVDPYAETDVPPGAAGNPLATMNASRASDLQTLFDAWGLEMANESVVGDLELSRRVQFANNGGAPMVINYPVWMDVPSSYLAAGDVVTANMGNLAFASAGALELKDDARVTWEPLVQSGPQAMKISTSQLGFLANPQDLVRGFRPEGQFTLAARLSGKVPSAFPDGAPKAQDAEAGAAADGKPAPHLAESTDPINVIVVADTDLLQDRFWVQVQNFLGQRIAIPTAANGTLVVNALDNLSGSSDLISVRNRGDYTRPFTKVRALQQQAEQRFLEKEQQLQARLQETERKLQELQASNEGGSGLLLSPEQQQELAKFRQEKIEIRQELRNVQHQLRKDIESLEGWVKFLNVGLLPLLIGVGGIVVGTYRIRRRRNPVPNALAN